MLTEADRQLLQRAFAHGPAALVEEGFSAADAAAFLARPDVQQAWAAFQREYDKQEVIFGHTKFVLRRQLTRLGPGATAILATALAGPRYARNAQGTILTDAKGHPILEEPEPTFGQLHAAKEVLDRLEVVNRTKDEGARTNINILFQQDRTEQRTALVVDPALESEEQRALSRERVRNIIEALRDKLPALRTRAEAALTAPAVKPAPPAKRPTRRALRKRVAAT